MIHLLKKETGCYNLDDYNWVFTKPKLGMFDSDY